MLDKLRQLERGLDISQDYLAAVRERIYPIKGKASLGEGSLDNINGKEDGWGSGDEYSGDGRGLDHFLSRTGQSGDGWVQYGTIFGKAVDGYGDSFGDGEIYGLRNGDGNGTSIDYYS